MRGVVFLALLLFSTNGAAEGRDFVERTEGQRFLSLTSEQRHFWINGAVMTLAHAIAVQDKAKGNCVSAWYAANPAAKQKVVEGSLAANPDALPTTIIIALAIRACGSWQL